MRAATTLMFAMSLMAMAVSAQTQEAKMQETKMKDQNEVFAVIDTMTTAFAKGDIDTVMSTYAPEAVVVGEPGKPITGNSELRGMFASFVEAGVAFTYGAHEVVIAGDTALHLMKWTAPQPDGGTASALSVAVLRRQPDGAWKMVIDHPFGDAVMAAQ
ncbi:MAG: YybH family protein [Panacagrimonas sp.]